MAIFLDPITELIVLSKKLNIVLDVNKLIIVASTPLVPVLISKSIPEAKAIEPTNSTPIKAAIKHVKEIKK